MKIKRVWAKNFRSIDAMGMELVYQPGATMVGSIDNGAGKSTMLVHALYYAWFDKNYSKQSSKAKLINNRSNKECIVEVEWQNNGHDWKLQRGMKPTVFSIWKDGVLLDEEAALKDVQANLAKIVGLDERVFCNTVVLGLDKFVPFVSMSAADRRNHGEQMMDLMVVGSMSTANKEQIKILNAQRVAIEGRLGNHLREIRAITEIIDVKKRHVTEASDVIKQDIAVLEGERSTEAIKLNEFRQLAEQISERMHPFHIAIQTERNKEQAKNQALQKKANYENVLQRLQNDAGSVISQMEAIGDSTCQCCGQALPEDQREAQRAKLQAKAVELLNGADLAQAELDKIVVPEYDPAELQRIQDQSDKVQQECQRQRAEEYACKVSLSNIDVRLQALRKRLKDSEAVVSWAEEETKLTNEKLEYTKLEGEADELNINLQALQALQDSFADDAVKAQIAEQFIPYLNERVNYYLNTLNLYLNIRIDNEFEIKMDAPDRRNQTIHDLSAGQQRRVDLAVLLAWRDIAKATSSCHCNLLVLDEILENLSEAGVADFLEMWQAQSHPEDSLFVITQRRTEFQPMFDSAIIYALVDESTRLVEED